MAKPGFYSVWWCLLLFRIGWTLFPQAGYIHPDEFFQTVEVIAGDAFNISVVRTWEFNETFPLRSIALPKLLFQAPFQLLQVLSQHCELFTLTGYLVLVTSRLVMLILSLWIDFCVYKVCHIAGARYQTALLLLASSYVTLTFQSHSFSNSLETVLLITEFLIFVCLVKRKVTVDMETKHSKKTSALSVENELKMMQEADNISTLHKNAYNMRLRSMSKMGSKTPGPNFPHHFNPGGDVDNINQSMLEEFEPPFMRKYDGKSIKRLSSIEDKEAKLNQYYLIILLAIVNAFGFFNRPTFAVFVVAPFLWWLFVYLNSNVLYKYLALFTFTSFISFLSIVAIDSCYYKQLSFSFDSLFSLFYDLNLSVFQGDFTLLYSGLHKMASFDLESVGNLTETFAITPLNFLIYNTAAGNLETHGLHPRYVHLLVNFPLLFGPLLIPVLYTAYSHLKHLLFDRSTSDNSKARSKTVISENDEAKLKAEKNKSTGSANIFKNNSQVSRSVDMMVSEKLQSDLRVLLTACIFVPIILLSVFPHQEPRFLIPLLPFVVVAVTLECRCGLHTIFWLIIVIFNIFLAVVFGMLHQGGVVPCLLHLQTLTSKVHNPGSSNHQTNISVVFSHTYMPPKHLLLHSHGSDLNLVDMQGQDLDHVCQYLTELKQDAHEVSEKRGNRNSETNKVSEKRGNKNSEMNKFSSESENQNSHSVYQIAYLALPGTLFKEFMSVCRLNVKLKKIDSFYPHLSFEDPPDLNCVKNMSMFDELLSLHLFEVVVL